MRTASDKNLKQSKKALSQYFNVSMNVFNEFILSSKTAYTKISGDRSWKFPDFYFIFCSGV